MEIIDYSFSGKEVVAIRNNSRKIEVFVCRLFFHKNLKEKQLSPSFGHIGAFLISFDN
jgi:hypothetical protein